MSEERHQQRQQRIKEKVDARIAAAQETRGIVMIFTGNGKGKSTAAFGTVARAVGHGHRAGVIQFIKGTWENGERNLLEPHGVEFQVMATALAVWEHGKRMLKDESLDLVVMDELTYMVSYGYIELEEVLTALKQRPAHQSVIITGRGCHRELEELADTVSEVRPVKHAFEAGIKAQKGIDW